ncbi:MAG TPA: dihydropteroate synthase [Limnochordia bacterium]
MASVVNEASSADLGGVRIGTRWPVRVMAAINVSPESFYKGSVIEDPGRLREAAARMGVAGADLIDIGAMSTAPYLETHIDAAEEARRIERAIRAVTAAVAVPISVDTKRASVARVALDCGARIINDVSGLCADPDMAPLAAERAAGVVLMADETAPGAEDPVATVRTTLADRLQRAVAAGIAPERIVLDPGIGFFRRAAWPWHAWDCRVLAHLSALHALGRPLVAAVSRKSFIGQILERPDPADRLAGSLAAVAIAVYNGAALVRTHDVAEARDAIRVAEALRRHRPEGDG